jgi:hypothetical protein
MGTAKNERDAQIKAINRRLTKEERKLRVSRSAAGRKELGEFYIVDIVKGTVTAKHVSLGAVELAYADYVTGCATGHTSIDSVIAELHK